MSTNNGGSRVYMQGHVSCGGWKGSAGEAGRDDDLCKKSPERKLGYISPGSKLRPQLTTPHGCGLGSSNTADPYRSLLKPGSISIHNRKDTRKNQYGHIWLKKGF